MLTLYNYFNKSKKKQKLIYVYTAFLLTIFLFI